MTRLRENQVFRSDQGEVLRIEQLVPHTQQVILKNAQGFTRLDSFSDFTKRLVLGEYRPDLADDHVASIAAPPQVVLSERQMAELKRRKELMDLCRQVRKPGMSWEETIEAGTAILRARAARKAAQVEPEQAEKDKKENDKKKKNKAEKVEAPLEFPCKRTLQRWQHMARAASSDMGLAPAKGGWRPGRPRRADLIGLTFEALVRDLESNGELQNFKSLAGLLNTCLQRAQKGPGPALRATPRIVAEMLRRELPWRPRIYTWLDSRSYRALTREAKALHDAQRPLELVEIDALIPDFHICDTDGVILGAPTVYAAIDVATGNIIGIDAYLQSPGTEPLMDFCSQAFFPKPPLEDGTELPWGVPERVLSDQGAEFRSEFWANLMLKLGSAAVYAEGDAGWRKPHIERFFKTIQESLIWRMSGSTRSEVRKTNDPNLPVRTGSITLSEFRTMIRRFAYEIYPTIVSERLSMKFRTPEMTPRKAWEKLIRDYPPTVPITREDFLGTTAQFLGEVKLTHKGVVFRHIWYSSDALFDLRRQFGDIEVVLYGSPIDIGTAHVKHIESGRTAQVWAKDASVHGMTRSMWDKLRAHLDIGRKKPGAEAAHDGITKLIEQSQELASTRKTRARKKSVQVGASAALGEKLREQRDAAGPVTPPAVNDAYARDASLAANEPTVPFPPSVAPIPFTGNGTSNQAGTTRIVRLSDLDGEQS